MKQWSSMFSLILPLVLLLVLKPVTGTSDTISDDELIERIKSNEYVVALFVKNNCPECDKYAIALNEILEDLKNFPAEVVTVMNSQMVRLYNPKKEPSLVFFRHGIPLLYDGPIHAEAIHDHLEANKIPTVKQLEDANFEHATQASTGSTTGDWFIMFYNRECIDCQRLSAIWEAVGAKLRNRVNVARVDKDVSGVKTAQRFHVKKAPEFIFIRHGNFYRYPDGAHLREVAGFVAFALSTYRNAKTESVKQPASPFDELVTSIVAYLKNIDFKGINNLMNDSAHFVPVVTIIGFVLIVILLKCWLRLRKQKVPEKTDDSTKKSK